MSPSDAWYDWFGLNHRLFLIINGFQLPWFDAFMLGVSTMGHPSLYPFYIAITLLWSRAKPASLPPRNIAVFALSYVLTSVLIVPTLKSGFDFPRPAQVLGDAVKLLGAPDSNHSFPSGHAAFAVLTAASLLPGCARAIQWSLVTFTFLVCVSRIWVGAHYPADVLAGGLIALVVVIIINIIIHRGNGE